MDYSKLSVRAALVALAFGLVQGCTALPNKAAASDELNADSVYRQLYTTRVYITGSRLPRKADARRSMSEVSMQPLRVMKIVQQ